MPDINIHIDPQQVDHVNRMLSSYPKQAYTVFKRSIDRGLIAARTQAAREIRERYDIKTSNLRTYQTIRTETGLLEGDGVAGRIRFSGRKIPLYRFHPSPAVRRYTNRYVNGRSGWRVTSAVSAADVRGEKRRLDAGFIATFKTGHTGIFRRTNQLTRTGKPVLKEYWGFSVADMLNYPDARENVLERAQEMTARRIDQELYRVLNGF